MGFEEGDPSHPNTNLTTPTGKKFDARSKAYRNSKRESPKYTKTGGGKKEGEGNGGWSQVGIDRFNELFEEVRKSHREDGKSSTRSGRNLSSRGVKERTAEEVMNAAALPVSSTFRLFPMPSLVTVTITRTRKGKNFRGEERDSWRVRKVARRGARRKEEQEETRVQTRIRRMTTVETRINEEVLLTLSIG